MKTQPKGSPFQRYLKPKVNSGVVLLIATAAALIFANTSLRYLYNAFWEIPMRLQIENFNFFEKDGKPMCLGEFINDVLMVIFFFSAGLEIKREMLAGSLRSFGRAILPVFAACGGMIFPVLIFYLISHGDVNASKGIAISMPTDIAFSVGVLSLLGSRVPTSLKVFLTTFAVADDIGGIIIIALFFSTTLHFHYLIIAAITLIIMAIGGNKGIRSKLFYFILGVLVWYCFVRSGVHPTIAGVLIAFTIPAKPAFNVKKYIKSMKEELDKFPMEEQRDEKERNILTTKQLAILKNIESDSDKVISPLQDFEDNLHIIVNFIIMPVFAFANAGITFGHIETDLLSTVAISAASGLVIGKPIGIFLFTWLLIKLKIAPMPKNMTWKNLLGISVIGGIGFTVSLFIADLSYADLPGIGQSLLNQAKLGVILGSTISGIIGFILLNIILPKKKETPEKAIEIPV